MFRWRRLPSLWKCGLCQKTHPVAQNSVFVTPEKAIFLRSYFASQHRNDFLNDDQSLINLGRKINNTIAISSQKHELIEKFNLSEKVLDSFQQLCKDRESDEQDYEAALNGIREMLDDHTLAMLEAVFSGTCAEAETSSVVKCHGCGAVLQSRDRLKPGFISSEQMQMEKQDLQETKCKRCSSIEAYDIALTTTMKPKHFKRMVATHIKSNKQSAVLAMVDLTDITNETLSNLLTGTVHRYSEIILIGNKFDLLPPDSSDFDNRIIDILKDSSRPWKQQIKDVRLISAKTGFGVEDLITSIMNVWFSQRDIYLIGAVNAGKSTLFNTLLQSDLVKGQTMEYFKKATVSKWPGTTLSTLKFPLQSFTPGQFRARYAKLASLKRSQQPSKAYFDRYATGEVDRSMISGLSQLQTDHYFQSPFEISAKSSFAKLPEDQRWFNDTPGLLNEDSVLPSLNQNELQQVIPTAPYVPRIYSLMPNQALTFGGLGRIEYLRPVSRVGRWSEDDSNKRYRIKSVLTSAVWGTRDILIFLFSSPSIPTVIASIKETEENFSNWVDSEKLQVPSSMSRFDELGSFHSIEQSWSSERVFHAFADVVFRSTGWATLMTRHAAAEVTIRASCLHSVPILRVPLLASPQRLMGKRLVGTPKYSLRKDYSKVFIHGKKLFKRKKKPLPSDTEFDELFGQ